MKARKKPVVIDYLPYKGDAEEVELWLNDLGDNFSKWFELIRTEGPDWYDILKVNTLEGISYEVTDDDVIIRDVKGEYYPCKKDIFEATYESI